MRCFPMASLRLTDAAVSTDFSKNIHRSGLTRGKLKQRVRLCFMWSPENENADVMIAERKSICQGSNMPGLCKDVSGWCAY